MSKTSSMGRGMLAILAVGERHAEGHDGGTVAEVAGRLEKDRSQVSRSLKGALQEGFLARTQDRAYRLDWSLLTDAQLVTDQRLRTDGLAALEGLAAETTEACFLGVLSGNSTVTIAEHVPASANLVGSWLGRPYPAYCSDAGQALLWDAPEEEVRRIFHNVDFLRHGPNTPLSVDEFLLRLDGARARGYSIVDEEAEPGLYSLSAPIRDFKGEVVAALQIVGPKTRLEPQREHHALALASWRDWLEARVGGAAETEPGPPIR
ncbi:IclR family transcriptional regulator [Paenarthrobacter ureafaciens]|jgi:DNA-binding IclR family transcriptional regulator|uniref:IclR family transcriptional regulator n=1 Tax=Paenarthrobacter ureafaciens TaxID=37931 RepID=UPI001C2BAEC5|nr:IclR family transcriptional regulator [Paenarthrobacter ureafaciens]UOD81294.1 IclR family transcriptional regulator [Paenarthrobacter ureafaciens]WNZ03944.1 IclR family transcriptional regulator [Paenarthrobacter ureafaciens]